MVFVIRCFAAFCPARFVKCMRTEHLHFKDEHCACVASVSPQPRIKKKNPYNSKEVLFAQETFGSVKTSNFVSKNSARIGNFMS